MVGILYKFKSLSSAKINIKRSHFHIYQSQLLKTIYFRLFAIRSWYSEKKDFTYGSEAKVLIEIMSNT